MKLRACFDLAVEWASITHEQRGQAPIAGLAAALHWIAMGMWGRPNQSPVAKKIAACGDRGLEAGYHGCFRHGQYLLTNIVVNDGLPMIEPGREPPEETLLAFFKVKAINKLLAKIRPTRRQRAAQLAVEPAATVELDVIKQQTRVLERLRGISFRRGENPSILP